jgi:hypothetical protein
MREAQAKQDADRESDGRRKKSRKRKDERQKEKKFCEQGHRRQKEYQGQRWSWQLPPGRVMRNSPAF